MNSQLSSQTREGLVLRRAIKSVERYRGKTFEAMRANNSKGFSFYYNQTKTALKKTLTIREEGLSSIISKLDESSISSWKSSMLFINLMEGVSSYKI